MIEKLDYYKVTMVKLDEIWNNHQENGVTAMKLSYDDQSEMLTIHCRCIDDCAPYWSWCGEYDCNLKNFAILLTYIAERRFVDEYSGKPRTIFVEWDWYERE